MKIQLYCLVMVGEIPPLVFQAGEGDESQENLLARILQAVVEQPPAKGNLSHHPAKTQVKLVGHAPTTKRKPVGSKPK